MYKDKIRHVLVVYINCVPLLFLRLLLLHYINDPQSLSDVLSNHGYKMSLFSSDVNECLSQELHSCSSNGECGNTIGSYQCSCLPGYSGDGRVCTDIDECSLGVQDCSVDAHCSNTIGSYLCSCVEGFHGDGKSCQDLDECKDNLHTCSVHALCKNIIGSYHCTCLVGFQGDGKSCQDLDECKDNLHNCSVVAVS